VIGAARCTATGANRIGPSGAGSFAGGRFAAVERDGDHLADELSIG
jgi:hypothetical protein